MVLQYGRWADLQLRRTRSSHQLAGRRFRPDPAMAKVSVDDSNVYYAQVATSTTAFEATSGYDKDYTNDPQQLSEYRWPLCGTVYR